MEGRKLTRSRSNQMIGGVCAGLGEYLKIDPTVIRLIFILLFILGGHGLLIYLILWIIMPIEPEIVPSPAQTPQPPVV